jgi:uncharacterized peroxidase-related enzyme
MSILTPQSLASAPSASRAGLEAVQKQLGFIPNLFATFAESPTLLSGYLALDAAYARGTLRPLERQLVLIAASIENACEYCVAAHSTIATSLKAPEAVLRQVRAGVPLDDRRLDALVHFTRAVVRLRGAVGEEEVANFLAAGFTKEQLGEVLVGIGLKTMSNYFNAIAATPLDPAFQPQAWRADAASP